MLKEQIVLSNKAMVRCLYFLKFTPTPTKESLDTGREPWSSGYG